MKQTLLRCSLLLLLTTIHHPVFSQGKARYNQTSYMAQGLKLSAADKQALIKEYSKTPAGSYLLIIDGKMYGKAPLASVIKSAKDLGHTGVPDVSGGQGALMEWCTLACTLTTIISSQSQDLDVRTTNTTTEAGLVDMSRLKGRDIQTRLNPVLQKYNVKAVAVSSLK
jgi:hypothetical protein